MVCFPLKYSCVVYMLLLIRCSQSADRLQQFYQNWKFLSSVYSFITSPGTLPQEIVICFHLGILGPACSGVSWVSLFYYHRWKHIFPWCRGREAASPKQSPGPGTSTWTGSCFHLLMPLLHTLLLLFSKQQGGLQCFCHHQQNPKWARRVKLSILEQSQTV